MTLRKRNDLASLSEITGFFFLFFFLFLFFFIYNWDIAKLKFHLATRRFTSVSSTEATCSKSRFFIKEDTERACAFKTLHPHEKVESIVLCTVVRECNLKKKGALHSTCVYLRKLLVSFGLNGQISMSVRIGSQERLMPARFLARQRGRGTRALIARAITKLTPSVGVDLTKNAPFKFLHFAIGGCSVYAFPST